MRFPLSSKGRQSLAHTVLVVTREEKDDGQDVWYVTNGKLKKAKRYTRITTVVQKQVVRDEDGVNVGPSQVYESEKDALVALRQNIVSYIALLKQEIGIIEEAIEARERRVKDKQLQLKEYQRQLEELDGKK